MVKVLSLSRGKVLSGEMVTQKPFSTAALIELIRKMLSQP